MTNFYDLRKEVNENQDISGDQNASVFSSYQVSSGLLCYTCGNVRSLSAQSFTFSADWLYGEIFYFTYSGSVTNFFFHFSVVFWLYGDRVINLQSKPLNRLLCECATEMIWVIKVPKIFPMFRVVSTLSRTLDKSRIIGEF